MHKPEHLAEGIRKSLQDSYRQHDLPLRWISLKVKHKWAMYYGKNNNHNKTRGRVVTFRRNVYIQQTLQHTVATRLQEASTGAWTGHALLSFQQETTQSMRSEAQDHLPTFCIDLNSSLFRASLHLKMNTQEISWLLQYLGISRSTSAVHSTFWALLQGRKKKRKLSSVTSQFVT